MSKIDYPTGYGRPAAADWDTASKSLDRTYGPTRGINDATPEEWDAAAKVVSDGGSSKYYELPKWAKEIDDLIVHKKMPWHVANIFKACYRWDEKDGNTVEYEANKMQWFATALQKHIKAGRY